MSIPSILGHGAFLFALLLIALVRVRPRKPLSHHHRLPNSQALAGVPLRILLSDRSGPGTVLRDALIVHPSTRD